MGEEGCSENGMSSNENCGSRTFEKEVYWTNFKSMRFFQLLPSDFQSHLGISAPWSRTYLARNNKYIELRANGRKWTARFNVQPRFGGGVLVSGWSKFAIDNSLQEYDVCLFKLVSQKDEPAIFDVQIFRAAPEIAH